ncbi:MAG TPA: UDP-N-acetylmuramate dehydrogenase [Opitutaceae bacterium]|jgi:UDP-N-acetylmuramate--alanine ligase|nr:UDP-N-acetylmuramate dehydrogenase [Opitutaceae bacterium]
MEKIPLRNHRLLRSPPSHDEMRPAAPPLLFSRAVRGIHCVGVGGMGVGPLAIYLAQLGFSVSGEDDALTEPMRVLLARERVTVTATGGLPAGCELVAFSSAIAPSHPARAAAVARGLPLVRRGELLAEVLRGRKLVAVCGAHGKTTTTALLITALRRANFPAGWILGGLFVDDAAPPARAGSNDWVVAEIDESDGTIDAFAPEITIATNLDWDHPDHYRRLDDFAAAFAALFARTKSAVLTSDVCPLSQRLVAGMQPGGAQPRFFTFGRSGDFSCEIAGETDTHLRLRLGGRFLSNEASVRARGEFNAVNAAAALAAAQLIGAELAPRLLADYAGVCRRQSVLHMTPGLTVLEDYAHHPAEIRALLASLRRREGERGRLVVVFQPHRFSRTAQFKTEFAAALALADCVHLVDVYPAGEAPIAGGTTADIYVELKKNSAALRVDYLPGDDGALFRALSRGLQPGDLVAFVGAGDIDQKARAWLELRRADEMKAKIWDDFAAALRPQLSAGSRLVREESLASKTTMRVGGAARVYAEPATTGDLQVLLREAQARGVEVFLLGRGSNLIVLDEGVDGLVIALAHENWQRFEPRPDGRVWTGAGLRLKNLCGLAGKAGLAGFEFLEGIPGSVGGALRMNAGAMGGWMFDVVEEVEIMTPAGDVKILRKADMHVAYRHCAELFDAIALGALLRPAAQADAEAVNRQIDVYRRKRHETQPREPSAGCIFKNPPDSSAGRLIDEAGLKGERVGDAEVSPVHANFIVNRGHATSADVIALMRRVRARVRETRGIELEPEVLLYGKKWEEVL